MVREKFKWKLYLAAPQKMIHVRCDHKKISPECRWYAPKSAAAI